MSIEFDGIDQQPGHVAAVGVFAAHADFPHPGQVVHIVFFHIGAGVVADGSFKGVSGQGGTGDILRGADGGQGAAAIAAETEVDADAGIALFESKEFFQGGRVFGQAGEGDFPDLASTGLGE